MAVAVLASIGVTGASWVGLNREVAAQCERTADLKVSVSANTTRVTENEKTLAAQTQVLLAIKESLARLDHKLDRIEQKVDP